MNVYIPFIEMVCIWVGASTIISILRGKQKNKLLKRANIQMKVTQKLERRWRSLPQGRQISFLIVLITSLLFGIFHRLCFRWEQ